jgi:hypothetical protein
MLLVDAGDRDRAEVDAPRPTVLAAAGRPGEPALWLLALIGNGALHVDRGKGEAAGGVLDACERAGLRDAARGETEL